MSRQLGDRSVFDRTHGPAVGASGDGLEGAYSAILNSTPSAGTVKVIVPNLWGLTTARVAVCSLAFTGSPGDRVLVVFDEEKQPWVVENLSTTPPVSIVVTGADWHTPTMLNSWAAGGVVPGYLKDPMGFVHIRGLVFNGTNGLAAFTLPAGYRPAGQAFFSGVQGGGTWGYIGVSTAGAVAPNMNVATANGMYIDGITFLAEN
jgi:hypothetical protein